jgi:hypothetical protein
MSDRLLVDRDSNGVAEFAHFDADGNFVGLEWAEDVERILDANKSAQADGNRGFGATREMQHVASIPPVLMLKWAAEKGVHPKVMNSREGFEEIVLRMIQDPDYRWLRRDK